MDQNMNRRFVNLDKKKTKNKKNQQNKRKENLLK